MNEAEIMDGKFSPHLFWDVDPSALDWAVQKSFIIKRVLEYGLLQDWLVALRYYGKEEILNVTKGLRNLDKRALSFIATYMGIPKEQFRCYTTRQSMPPHWNF